MYNKFSRERLGNQRFESKKDSNTQNKTQWYHYNLTLVSNCYQDWYQGINIFREWYHYNLALVPSKCQPHAREIFQRIKWPNYPRLSLLKDSNGWLPRQAQIFTMYISRKKCHVNLIRHVTFTSQLCIYALCILPPFLNKCNICIVFTIHSLNFN